MKTMKAILALSTLLLLPLLATPAQAAGPGVFKFDEPSFSIPSGTTVVTVNVERSGGNTGAVSVQFAATAGTAVAGIDFVPNSGTLSWTNGSEITKTFTVTLLGAAGGGGKTINLTLSNPTGGATVSTDRGTATLILPGGSGGGGGGDDGGGGGSGGGATGRIGFDEHDFVAVADAGKAVITVERSGGSSGAAAVSYTTIDGTAVAGKDYTATAGTLNWASGDESTKTFMVTLAPTGAGTVKLQLSNPAGATLDGEHDTALLSIGGPGHDDHGGDTPGGPSSPGTIKFNEDSYQVIQGGMATITVERSNGKAGAVTVQYATSDGSGVAGTDYVPTSGTLSWNAGDESTKIFKVASLVTNGSGKTVRLNLSNPTGGATLGAGQAATLNVLDTHGDNSACVGDDTTLCVSGDRFRVRVTWRTGDGKTGAGHAAKLNANSGTFWFFDANNTEMLIKVLDACNPFNAYWVFYAATTNVSFTAEVTDTRTGLVKRYLNAFGQAAPPVNDTGTFATCR